MWWVFMAAALAGPTRVVAVGDVHGDLARARAAFALGGLVDDDGRWSGGSTVVVQVGDQLDRGHEERALMDWLAGLRVQAEAAGGRVVPLLGNHEIMNAQGDFRYVSPRGFEDFADQAEHLPEALKGRVPPKVQGRAAAFLPGGSFARRLANQPVTFAHGGTLFVHGGLHKEHVDYGLQRLNEETQAWLRGERASLPYPMLTDTAPVWTRALSVGSPQAEACAEAEALLDRLGLQRMVVAHTPQPTGIGSVCDGRVWRVDVGLSEHYGGPLQVLEIVGDEVRVIRE